MHAVATNDAGLTSNSSKVRFTVGDFVVKAPWTTFGNTTPRRRSPSRRPTSRSAPPARTSGRARTSTAPCSCRGHARELRGDRQGRVVRRHPRRLEGGDHGPQRHHQAANTSPGYMVFGEKGNGETEFMHDAAGNGQVNNTGEPVATGCGTGTQPNWLKVQKKDKVFTVWCSRDGVAWTQVGVPTAIPSAADVQDIGLFVVSHITGTLATATFTDWSLTEIDGGPDPDRASRRRPARRRARTSSTAGRRTRPAGPRCAARRTVTGGGAARCAVTNGDIDGTNQGAISYLGQAAPTGDWSATTKVTLDAGQRVAVRRPAPARRRRQLLEGHVHQAPGRLAVLRVLVGDRAAAGPRTRQRGRARRHRHDGLRALGGPGPRSRAPTRTTATAWTGIGRRAAQGGRQDRHRRGRRHDAQPDGVVRLVPHHAGPGARGPGLRRRVRRHGARRLPLGQDPQLEGRARRRGRRQALDRDVRRRHQRRRQRPDREPDPPDPARGRLDGRDEDDRAAAGQLAAGGPHALPGRRPLREVRRGRRQRPGRDPGPPGGAPLRERRRAHGAGRPGLGAAGQRHGHVVAAPDEDG